MSVELVFWSVVLARFALPLLIPLFPLPVIVGCLLLDGADQTIFQSFGYDPPYYQSYDKAMDVFYLSIAYLASLRNWTNPGAVRISRYLFYFRQFGAVAFELSGARLLLLVFPNTFEYFFIAYETARARWDPVRLLTVFWVLVAAGIWIFVKLPQEYWLHVARLDLTDTIRDVPWFGPALAFALVALSAGWYVAVRPRLPPTDWPWRFRAEPLPTAIDEAHERAAYQAAHRKVFDATALEKMALIGLICVIFAQVLPGVEARPREILAGTSVLVVINSAIGLWSAKRGYSWDSAAVSFAVVFATNAGLVLLADLLLAVRKDSLLVLDTLFFVFLFSVLTMLYDRYRPVNEYRTATAAGATPG